MTTPISNLSTLLATMEPALHDGVYVYSSVAHGSDVSQLPVIATMREAEGLTVVVAEDVAVSAGLPVLFRCAWIMLTVHSDLQAVGLTAAFAKALGDEGISCNVVAGAYHDHIFVPHEDAARAMSALQHLQCAARGLYMENRPLAPVLIAQAAPKSGAFKLRLTNIMASISNPSLRNLT